MTTTTTKCVECIRLKTENKKLRIKIKLQQRAIKQSRKACSAAAAALYQFYKAQQRRMNRGGLPRAVYTECRGRAQTAYWAFCIVSGIESILNSQKD